MTIELCLHACFDERKKGYDHLGRRGLMKEEKIMFIPRKLFVVKYEHIPGVQCVLYSESTQSL